MKTSLDDDEMGVSATVSEIIEVTTQEPLLQEAATPTLPPDVLELEAIKGVTITSNETRVLVAETLARAATRRKQQRELMDADLEPLKLQIKHLEAKRDERAGPHKFIIGALQVLEDHCQRTLRAYDVAEMARAAEEQRKKNAQIEARNERAIAKAEEKGVAPKLAAPVLVAAPVKQVATVMGSVNRKRIYVWAIPGALPTDIEKTMKTFDIPADDPRLANVPRKYLVLNASKITKVRSTGEVIEGLVCTEDFDYGHRRAK